MIHDAHVGTTCCVLSSIDHSILQIHARVTWGVVFIRAIALIVVVDVLTYITNTIKCSGFFFSSMYDLRRKRSKNLWPRGRIRPRFAICQPRGAPSRHLVRAMLVFIIHVGCTRCVTSSTDQIVKILARITLSVEFIRTCIFIFVLCLNTMTGMINTYHCFNVIDFQVRAMLVVVQVRHTFGRSRGRGW
jgi:hypothetical protein